MSELLAMTGIVKEFPGVRALDGVDLDVRPVRCTACSARTAPASPR
jgi:ABC-type sugar transport system ATPase subunit